MAFTTTQRGFADNRENSLGKLPSSVATVISSSSNQMPFSYVAPPSGDTSGATDGAAITTALAALPGGKGRLQFQVGQYYDSLQRTPGNYVCLRGAGGVSAGATPGTRINYTGTAASYLNWQNSIGAQVSDLMLFANNASFTGKLIDLSGTSSLLPRIERCYLGSADTTAAVLVYLDNAQDAIVYGCNIVGGLYGIQGIGTSGHFSNANSVIANRIGGQGASGAGIVSLGQGWNINGNVFERQSGQRGIGVTGSISGAGNDITGNWFGDATGSSASIEIFGAGVSISGNYIAGTATSKGVQFQGLSDGIAIMGNRFDTHSIGIDKNGMTVTNASIGPNSYSSVTTHNNFTAGGTLYIEA